MNLHSEVLELRSDLILQKLGGLGDGLDCGVYFFFLEYPSKSSRITKRTALLLSGSGWHGID